MRILAGASLILIAIIAAAAWAQCPPGGCPPYYQPIYPQPSPAYPAPPAPAPATPVQPAPAQPGEEAYRDATVLIANMGHAAGTGTIVAIADDGAGLVLTCAHLFVGRIGGQVDLRYADGSAGKGTLRALERSVDLAVLEIAGAASRTAVPIADGHPGDGAAVIQYGYPAEAGNRMNRRAGRIRNYVRGQLTLDMRVNHGDSGSGVFAGGRLIGVVSAKPIDATPLAYCTGIEEVKRFLSPFLDRFRFRRKQPQPPPPTPDPAPLQPRPDPPPPPPRSDPDPGGLFPRIHDRLGGIGDRLRALEEGARLLPDVHRRLEDLDQSARKLDQLGEGLRKLQGLEKLKDLAGGAAAIEGRLSLLPWIVGGGATGGSLIAGLLGYLAVRRGLGGLAGGIHALVGTLRHNAPVPPPTPASDPTPVPPPDPAVPQTRYVGVPTADARLAALNEALDYYARRYPGHLDFVQTIHAYADQYQSGRGSSRR